MPGAYGESLQDVYRRSTDFAEKVAAKYTGDVLIASHDAVIKTLLCYWLDAPVSSFWRFQIANCSITAVEILKGKSQVETINSCIAFPKNPIEPQIGDYDNSEDYEEALKDYEEEQANYMEICNEISRQGEAGEITLFMPKIGQADITLCYVEDRNPNS